MPENEFEKQVQQKMDELHFVPSAAVWPEVEKQIAERKKRRLLFIWLPFLLLILGSGVVLYYANSGKQLNKDSINENKSSLTADKTKQKEDELINDHAANKGQKNGKESSLTLEKVEQKEVGKNRIKDSTGNINMAVVTETEKKNLAEDHPIIAVENTASDKVKITAANKSTRHKKDILNAARLISDTYIIDENNYPKSKTISKKNKDDNSGYFLSRTEKLKTDHKNNDQKTNTKTIPADENILVANTGELKNGSNEAEKNIIQKSKTLNDVLEKKPDTANNNFAVAKNEQRDSLKNTSKQDNAKKITKNNSAAKNKKFEWGINVNAGVSNISQGFSRLLSNTPSYDMYSLASPTTNNSSGNANNNSSAGSSDVKPGFAFAAGIFVNKQLGKTYSLFAALNYTYLSTTLHTGGKIDTGATANDYRAGNITSYTNRFHFIQVPVMIEKRLGPLSRCSIDAGVTFSLLAGSNALQYDGQRNIYFVDNSYINKTQWSLLAGFNYRLLQKKTRLEIGPQLNYNLSNIYRKELYGSRHLFFAGISAKIFFGKK